MNDVIEILQNIGHPTEMCEICKQSWARKRIYSNGKLYKHVCDHCSNVYLDIERQIEEAKREKNA